MWAKPGWRRMLPVHTMRVGDVALERGTPAPRCGRCRRASRNGIAHPGRLDAVGRARPASPCLRGARAPRRAGRSCGWRRALNSASLSSLHEAVRGHDLRRLEVVADVVEHEDQVVGRAVGERAEAVVVALACCRTGTSRSGGPSAGARASGRTTRGRRPRSCRRCPRAVIEWPRAKLVTEMSERVPVRVPRSYESSTSQLSSTTSRPCASAMVADARPSRGSCPRGSA